MLCLFVSPGATRIPELWIPVILFIILLQMSIPKNPFGH